MDKCSGNRAAKTQGFGGVGALQQQPHFWPAEPLFTSAGTALALPWLRVARQYGDELKDQCRSSEPILQNLVQ